VFDGAPPLIPVGRCYGNVNVEIQMGQLDMWSNKDMMSATDTANTLK